MAIFKCKMCGGDLSVTEGMTIVGCDFCGVVQTVPSAKDENLQGLFNRANILRMKSEFDKAAQLYEKIIQIDNTQSEAYWGLILCKFGIEYVEDPTTFKRIPTCHRTELDSIIADDDYKLALHYADDIQKVIYKSEAKEIDRLQKEIISLSQKEEPYDVFICYKETDESGKRTQDSVIANDIYYQLTQEGFKVFFAAITLEDKLGSAYEPCIFAALNSAKVMLSIGTKPEYFNAIWVKNEWSRFLKIMKQDRSKILIPCYKDMDAYELPEEFAHLQAQDMSKIGFINDVVRGIRKVLSAGKPQTEKEPVTVHSNNANTAPLLQRVFIFLEDGNWTSADEYCEKVLDLEPQNALAYLGKLMAELRVHTQADFENCSSSIENNGNYQKAVRFADEALKDKLKAIRNTIQARSAVAKSEEIYTRALALKNSASTEQEYQDAAALFRTIPGWKDADVLARQCMDSALDMKKAKTYLEAVALAKQNTEVALTTAINLLSTIEDWKDASQLIEQYTKQRSEMIAAKETTYSKALHDMDNGKSFEAFGKYLEAKASYQAAFEVFVSLVDFKESKANANWCSGKLKAMEESASSLLTLVVNDSHNPLALADGVHYVYDITEKNSHKKTQAVVTLVRGITTRQLKLSPGNYLIELKVYGCTTQPGVGAPLHSAACSVTIGMSDHWEIISNRPGLFSKLQLSAEKH